MPKKHKPTMVVPEGMGFPARSPPSRSPTHCPPGFVLRAALRKRLGLSLSQFRALETKGVIRSTRKNGTGYAIYDLKLVKEIVQKRDDGSLLDDKPDGAMEAISSGVISLTKVPYQSEQGIAVFKLLKANVPLVDIVIETGLHPQVIRSILRDYDVLTGSATIPKSIFDEMNKLPLDGDFPLTCGSEILEVMKLAAKDRLCRICEAKPCASSCEGCIRKRMHAIAARKREEDQKQEETGGKPQVATTEQEPEVPREPEEHPAKEESGTTLTPEDKALEPTGT